MVNTLFSQVVFSLRKEVGNFTSTILNLWLGLSFLAGAHRGSVYFSLSTFQRFAIARLIAMRLCASYGAFVPVTAKPGGSFISWGNLCVGRAVPNMVRQCYQNAPQTITGHSLWNWLLPVQHSLGTRNTE